RLERLHLFRLGLSGLAIVFVGATLFGNPFLDDVAGTTLYWVIIGWFALVMLFGIAGIVFSGMAYNSGELKGGPPGAINMLSIVMILAGAIAVAISERVTHIHLGDMWLAIVVYTLLVLLLGLLVWSIKLRAIG